MLCDRHKFILREMLLTQLASEMQEIIENERNFGEESTRFAKVQWNEKYKTIHVLMDLWKTTIPSRFAPYDFPPETDNEKACRLKKKKDRFMKRGI